MSKLVDNSITIYEARKNILKEKILELLKQVYTNRFKLQKDVSS